MTTTAINIYFADNPLICNIGLNFKLGYTDNTGALYSLSNTDPNLTITILEPSTAKLINNNQTILMVTNNKNTTLRLQLIYNGYTQYYSYVVNPPYPLVSLTDIYNRLIELMPKKVYDNSNSAINNIDNMATAQVLYTLYNNQNNNNWFYSLNNIIDIIYPTSGANGWEYFLTGNSKLLEQENTQYGALLQHIYSIEINNNTNPYWLSFNISKYIYLWLKKQRFVYVSENIFSITDAFILNLNTLGNSIFKSNPNGMIDVVIFYVLTNNPDSTSALTIEEQANITQFIRQICRCGISIEVIYTQSAADLGLIYIADTYFQDPRQNQSYCIAYNENILSEALGYVAEQDSTQLENLTSFSFTNTTFNINVGQSVSLGDIITVPAWTGVTPIIDYMQAYSSDNDIMSISFDGTYIYVHGVSSGTAELSLYLSTLNYSGGTAFTFTIS